MRISDWSSDVCSSDLSFNTAFSPRKSQIGGKGLGRFTWLKAFDQALVKSTFRDDDATLHTRDFVFDQSYDLDERGLPKTATAQARGTTIHLSERKSTRLHSSHYCASRMPSSACKKHP